jgi:peptide/nickel transport system permease protein
MRVWLLALRRLAASLPTLFVILIGLFLLLQLAPGDTVDALVAQMGGGDTAMIEELRRFYGLDATVPVQLGRYLWRLVRLDLGFSAIYGKPVATVILERLPATLLLMCRRQMRMSPLRKVEMSPAAPVMLGTEVVSDDAGGDEQQRAWAR